MARTFGKTWWGGAWIDALVGIAGGESGRLSRGRTYARKGRAEDLIIEPGSVQAWVQGSRPDPYEVFLDIRALRADEWDVVIGAFAAKAAYAAALLDGEIEPGIVDDVAALDVHLLPRARDLRTACSCPDVAEPCKHAAAVTYLIAEAIDHDPFVLLLIRGRRRDEILHEIRSRRAGSPPSAPSRTQRDLAGLDNVVSLADWTRQRGTVHPSQDAAPQGGSDTDDDVRPSRGQATIDVADLWGRAPGELPVVPMAGTSPGRPAPWPSDPPPHAPFTRDGLLVLMADAAHRAWELAGGAAPSPMADPAVDLARRAATASRSERERMATRSGIPAVELDVAALGWHHGGAAGVWASAEGRWKPPPLTMAAARDVICDSGFAARRVHVSGNRITVEGRLQFRFSRDGNWYLFSKAANASASGRWGLVGPGDADIEELILRDLPE